MVHNRRREADVALNTPAGQGTWVLLPAACDRSDAMHISSRIPVKVFPLAKDDLGIAQTVMTMQQLIDSGAANPEVREKAIEITRRAGARPKDAGAEIQAVFHWVKQNFRFVKDVAGHETLGTVPYLLNLKAGDCDDYVVVLGALLTSLGYPVRVVTIAADPAEPKRFSHVYLQVNAHGRWVSLDGTQDHSFVGWEPPKHYRKKSWGNMIAASQSIGGLGAYRRLSRAPRGLGVDWESITNLATEIGVPLAQAGAQRIAYGQVPYIYSPAAYGTAVSATGGLTVAAPGLTQGISPWVLILGAGVVLAIVLRQSR